MAMRRKIMFITVIMFGSENILLIQLWGRAAGVIFHGWGPALLCRGLHASALTPDMAAQWLLCSFASGQQQPSGLTLTISHSERWRTGSTPDSWHLVLFLSERALYFLSVSAADSSVFLHSLSHRPLWDLIESWWWLCSSLRPGQFWYIFPSPCWCSVQAVGWLQMQSTDSCD